MEKEKSVQPTQNSDDKVTIIRLFMNEKYLVMNLVQVLDKESITSYTTIVWTRASNFSTVSLVLQRQKPGLWNTEPFTPNLFRSQHWRPAISNDLIHVPINLETTANFSEIVYSVWDMADGTFKDNVRKKYFTNALNTELTFLLNPATSKILITEHGLACLFDLNDDNPIWRVEKAGYTPCIVLCNEKYVGVEWTNIVDVYKLHLIIYDTSTGGNAVEIDLQNYFWQICEVQINGGRVAVTGGLVIRTQKHAIFDTVLYNLKNGTKIFSCAQDINLSMPTISILEKNRLLTNTYEGSNARLNIKALQYWK